MLAAALPRKGKALDHPGRLVGVVYQYGIAVGLRREIPAHGVCLNQLRLHDFLENRVDAFLHGDRLGVSLRKAFLHVAVQAHVLAVKHLRVQVRPQVVERQVTEHQAFECGDTGQRRVGAHRRAQDRAGDSRRRRRFGVDRALLQSVLLGLHPRDKVFAPGVLAEQVGQVEALHGVLGIQHRRVAIGGGDLRRREALRQCRTAHQDWGPHSGFPQVLRRQHHLLGRFDQQSRQADGVRLLGAVRFDELLRQDLDAQIDDLETIVAQDDVHQILADVMHVALHGGQDDLALQAALAFFQVGLQVRHRRLHHLGAEQDFGDNQLVIVE